MRMWDLFLSGWTPGKLRQEFPKDWEGGHTARDLIKDILFGKGEITLVDATPLVEIGMQTECEKTLVDFYLHLPVKMPYPFMWIELIPSRYAVFLQDIPSGFKLLPFTRSEGCAWPLELCCEVSLDEEGKLAESTMVKFGWIYGYGDSTKSERLESLQHTQVLLSLTLYALAMFHCKNVGMVLEPDPWADMPVKLQQKRLKKGNLPPARFRTLALRRKGQMIPLKQIVSEAGEDASGKALHAVRGHFRTYTKERPLMGRAVGTFWVPSFLRGDPDLGVVEKDYKLDASLVR